MDTMSRAPKVCAEPDCVQLTRGAPRCPAHTKTSRWPNRQYPRTSRAGHQARRLRVLDRDQHQCQLRYADICVGTATICDHIVALALGGNDTDENC